MPYVLLKPLPVGRGKARKHVTGAGAGVCGYGKGKGVDVGVGACGRVRSVLVGTVMGGYGTLPIDVIQC